MKKYFFLLPLLALMGCEKVVSLQTAPGPQQLVVDGWLTDQPGPQQIKLSYSQAYFDSAAARPVLGARVQVRDSRDSVFVFTDEKNNGVYVYRPAAGRAFGQVGRRYTLLVQQQNETYTAQTEMKRVPPVDSITYFFEKPTIASQTGPAEGYTADFWGTDFKGNGDVYWVRVLLNGKRIGTGTTQLSLAYDSGGTPGANTDGIKFILPVRRSINIDRRLYAVNDSLTVQLWSIDQPAYFFLNALRTETANQGIFATAPANTPTNVLSTRPGGPKVLGWFGASAVSSLGVKVMKENARPRPEGL